MYILFYCVLIISNVKNNYDYTVKLIEYCQKLYKSNHLKQHYAISLLNAFKIKQLYGNVSKGNVKMNNRHIEFEHVSPKNVQQNKTRRKTYFNSSKF